VGVFGHVLRPGTPRWEWCFEVGLFSDVGLMLGGGTDTDKKEKRSEKFM
jgi:hypothetical protein